MKEIRIYWNCYINPYHPTGCFLYPLKKENLWFFYVFKGIKRNQLYKIGLKEFHTKRFSLLEISYQTFFMSLPLTESYQDPMKCNVYDGSFYTFTVFAKRLHYRYLDLCSCQLVLPCLDQAFLTVTRLSD